MRDRRISTSPGSKRFARALPPTVGTFGARACPDIAPGLFRIGYLSHVVFFRQMPYGIRVLRILHERQLPELHSFEDDEEDE
jgi:plasmid stabilization system protein ParE